MSATSPVLFAKADTACMCRLPTTIEMGVIMTSNEKQGGYVDAEMLSQIYGVLCI